MQESQKDELLAKIDVIEKRTKRIERYFVINMVMTVATVVLPLIAALSVLPWLLEQVEGLYSELL